MFKFNLNIILFIFKNIYILKFKKKKRFLKSYYNLRKKFIFIKKLKKKKLAVCSERAQDRHSSVGTSFGLII